MAEHAPPGAGDFEAMARQFWNLWGDALRQASGAAAPAPAPAWTQALDWWSRLMPGGRGPAEDALHRFRQQSGDWYGLMQQVAARFAGQNAGAGDVTAAWKQALGMDAGQGPWMDFFRGLQGGGAGGFEHWYRQVSPYMDNLRRENERWLHLPAFGPAREHQERWQALAQAQQDYQQALGEYERVMLKVAGLAFERFESLLDARAEPGQQITSARALFDLWIDAAEQAYAEVALSPEFRHVYGHLTNTQMRLRLGVQTEIEQICVALGMPGRTEVDSAHRKIAELERQLRRMSRRDDALDPRDAAQPARRQASRAGGEGRRGQDASAARATRPAKPRGDAKPASVPRAATATAAKISRTAAGTKPAKAVKPAKPAKPSGTAKAAKSAEKAPVRSARGGDGEVVSMKDWVARNAHDGGATAGRGKGKRGQGGRK
ncbi:class III poly(R)-hydroxyalkanoic acid synthase subunit PhaE [Pseudoxanthomonas japonensis]|nr:class III poly(R)-hydroxyalkanoic acid synthase subunit PhaE [Pseudoxanthomonas japonensis]